MSRSLPTTGSRASLPPAPQSTAAAPTYSKYGNKKTAVDGITFASRKEARRYGELILLQKGGVISRLVVQPVCPLLIAGVKVGKYIGDFRYLEGNREVIEDVKGGNATKTAVWALKWRIVKALYPDIDWRIV